MPHAHLDSFSLQSCDLQFSKSYDKNIIKPKIVKGNASPLGFFIFCVLISSL